MKKDKNKIWLSHSGLDILHRCPRCFWLKYKRGIQQPEEIVSRLPDRFDRVIKGYFNGYREIQGLPPLIKEKIEGKLEHPFQESYFYDIDERYGFYVKLDECLVTSDNKYIPIDFKTSSSDPRKQDIFSSYQNQIDEFIFLLEKNNKKTNNFGYLIYFYPEDSKNLHDGFPMSTHIQKVRAFPEKVLPRLREAIEALEQDSIPQPSSTCSFCKWYGALTEILTDNYQKGRQINQTIEERKMPESIYSKKLEAGGKTYFFDIREAQSGNKYLQVTESRLKQDGERYRSNIVIFKEYFDDFRQILNEIAEQL